MDRYINVYLTVIFQVIISKIYWAIIYILSIINLSIVLLKLRSINMQHAMSSLSHIITLEGYSEFIYSVSLKQNVLDDCM